MIEAMTRRNVRWVGQDLLVIGSDDNQIRLSIRNLRLVLQNDVDRSQRWRLITSLSRQHRRMRRNFDDIHLASEPRAWTVIKRSS